MEDVTVVVVDPDRTTRDDVNEAIEAAQEMADEYGLSLADVQSVLALSAAEVLFDLFDENAVIAHLAEVSAAYFVDLGVDPVHFS